MIDDEPNLVTSGRSRRIMAGGFSFAIEIHRLETDPAWTLEVVDEDGTSHVWDEPFGSDEEALAEALRAIEAEGPAAFMRADNVVPFRRS